MFLVPFDDVGDSEIEGLDHELPVRAPHEEEIRRLEVSMDDSQRMRLCERDAGLKDELHCLPMGRGRRC